jgi:hypothetical protein
MKDTPPPSHTPASSATTPTAMAQYHTLFSYYVQPETIDFPCHISTIKHLKLDFSPESYPFFDGMIATHCGFSPLGNPHDPNHIHFRPLRKNLAVLRNFLISTYLSHEAFQATTTLAYIEKIAFAIAEMLKRGNTLIRNPFEPALILKEVNVLGYGGQLIYQALQQLQKTEHIVLKGIKKPLHPLALHLTTAHALPAIALTPFGNLQAPAKPTDTQQRDASQAIAAQAAMHAAEQKFTPQQRKENALDISDLSDDIVALRHTSTLNNRSVEELDEKTKAHAIDIGREILRKLKLLFSDTDVENLMKVHPNDVRIIMNDVKKVTDLFRHYLDQVDYKNRDLLEHPNVVKALQATGTFAAAAKLYAINEAKQSSDKTLAEQLAKEYEKMPTDWKGSQKTKVGELIDHLDKGLKTLQYHLLNQTSNLPDNDQMKDLVAENSKTATSSGMSTVQAEAQQKEQTRVQTQMLQEDEYRRMLAERRKANQATSASQSTVTAPQQQASAAQTASNSTTTVSQSALDTPRQANQQAQQGRRNRSAAEIQARWERRQAQRVQQQLVAEQQQQAAQKENRPKRSSQDKDKNKDFSMLLESKDVQAMRGSINKETTGTLVEANSAKKVVEDKIREGSQTRASHVQQVTAPPPPPPRPISETTNDDPNAPTRKTLTR